MALSLKAEQKNLVKLFETEDIYVIPSYQRPYSWEFEQCDQLYKDITAAFNNNVDYFLGNIIIARSDKENLRPNIVDGQQRMITLCLIIKTLTILCPHLRKFKRMLYVEDNREENANPKIASEIYETNDNEEIKKVLSLTDEMIKQRYAELSVNNTLVEERCTSKIEYNFYIFYKWFFEFRNRITGISFDDFVEFFFRKIYLLPIELDGGTIDEANDKALNIFETINNRGMSLEDADILKAKLYDKSKNVGEQNQFIELWGELKRDCNDLDLSIDELFRYYYHVLRGLENNTSAEKKLRDYFIKDLSSPLHKRDYAAIMNDLSKLIDILQYLNVQVCGSSFNSNWLKVLYVYSNLYPRYALVAYLYAEGTDCNPEQFGIFLQNLTRYVYGKGSTTTIKFEIYNIIRDAINKEEIKAYRFDQSLDLLNWKRISPLRRGFAMLAFFLMHTNFCTDEPINIDRIIPIKDLTEQESIGNFVLLTCAKSRGSWAYRKQIYEKRCNNSDLISQWGEESDLPLLVQKRTEAINKILADFFYV